MDEITNRLGMPFLVVCGNYGNLTDTFNCMEPSEFVNFMLASTYLGRTMEMGAADG